MSINTVQGTREILKAAEMLWRGLEWKYVLTPKISFCRRWEYLNYRIEINIVK
jgi:hypothetical protein